MALKKLLGFWVNEKSGRKYMSGKTNQEIVIPAGKRLMIFKNDRKEKENQPDYQLMIAED